MIAKYIIHLNYHPSLITLVRHYLTFKTLGTWPLSLRKFSLLMSAFSQ